jgi:hypothetical protein
MELTETHAPFGVWQLSDSAARPVRTAPAGRVCQEVHCTTMLSIYNHGSRCSRHRIPVEVRRRRGRVLT